MSEKKSTKSSKPEGGSKKPADSSKKPAGKKPAAGKGPFGFYWAYLAIGGMLIAMLMFNTGGGGKEIHWKGFTEKVEAGDVEHVQHDGLRVQVFLTESARENAMEDQDDEQLMRSWVQGADFWFNLPPGCMKAGPIR